MMQSLGSAGADVWEKCRGRGLRGIVGRCSPWKGLTRLAVRGQVRPVAA